ncbi:hypothetical protein ACOMCP_03397 (plasmid) [Lactiplantibacillus plantarum]
MIVSFIWSHKYKKSIVIRKKTTNITINHEYKADLAPLSIF